MRALVTGGSRGIGRATAFALARDGFEVTVHGHRHFAEAEAVADGIREAGGSARAVEANLTRADGVERLARAMATGGRSLEALVLNAGTYPRASFSELDASSFEECFRLNVVHPAELTRRLLPLLGAAAPGRVVFVSSILAFDGSRHGAHYAAAKAALLGLARSLARELAPGILVNVVAPGSIDTAILEGDTPKARKEREARIPLGRIGTPAEVAEAVAYLASARASYLTGTTIHVNGGLRME